jgi:hypothetical protein
MSAPLANIMSIKIAKNNDSQKKLKIIIPKKINTR